MICARCGHRNEADARFCSACGTGLAAAPPGGAPGEDTTATLAAVEAGPAPGPGGAVLVVVRGPNAGSTYRLHGPSTSLGRHPDSDVFLDDITVSRRHAVVEAGAGGVRIRDVGSLNGTYLNRRRVEEATLCDGDELQIGRFVLRYHEVGRSGS
jgi:hypothetical protein